MPEFGQRITWTSESVVPPGHQMTFKDALHTLSTNLLLKIVLPNWASNLTKQTKQVQLAFMELKVSSPRRPGHAFSSMSHISSRNTCRKWWKLAEMWAK